VVRDVDFGHGFWTPERRFQAGEPPAVAEKTLVSMGGCIASALTVWSAVEVVGAVLGTVSSRAGRGVGAVAAGVSRCG
jgi:hypothetical protein